MKDKDAMNHKFLGKASPGRKKKPNPSDPTAELKRHEGIYRLLQSLFIMNRICITFGRFWRDCKAFDQKRSSLNDANKDLYDQCRAMVGLFLDGVPNNTESQGVNDEYGSVKESLSYARQMAKVLPMSAIIQSIASLVGPKAGARRSNESGAKAVAGATSRTSLEERLRVTEEQLHALKGNFDEFRLKMESFCHIQLRRNDITEVVVEKAAFSILNKDSQAFGKNEEGTPESAMKNVVAAAQPKVAASLARNPFPEDLEELKKKKAAENYWNVSVRRYEAFLQEKYPKEYKAQKGTETRVSNEESQERNKKRGNMCNEGGGKRKAAKNTKGGGSSARKK